ncbi:MAG: protein kinase [Chlamydiota bacterium]
MSTQATSTSKYLSDPRWLATLNYERAHNYLHFLDQRLSKIQTLEKALLEYADNPLNAHFPEEPSKLLARHLEVLPRTHLSVRSACLSLNSKPLILSEEPLDEPLSARLQALLDPVLYKNKYNKSSLISSNTLLTFIEKGPIIDEDRPRTPDPRWIATLHHERATNHLRFLNHQQNQPQKTDPSFEPQSTQLKALLDPPIYINPYRELSHRINTKSPSIKTHATIKKCSQEAARYLYPRTLANHPHLRGRPIAMPQDTTVFMRAAFEGISLTQDKLAETLQGGLSIVYKTQLAGTSYIIKKFSKERYATSQDAQELPIQEQINNLLFATTSNHIVNVKAMTQDALILHYLEGGDLYDLLLNSQKRIEPQQFQKICSTIIDACLEIESEDFCYSDIKLENIFLSKDLNSAQLGDLGLTHPVTQNRSSGSICYSSPDTLNGKNSVASDVFSFGILLFYYLFEQIPEAFLDIPSQEWDRDQGRSIIIKMRISELRYNQLYKHMEHLLDHPLHRQDLLKKDPSKLFRSLMMQCLCFKPEHRPSLAKIKEILSPSTTSQSTAAPQTTVTSQDSPPSSPNILDESFLGLAFFLNKLLESF